MAKKNDARPQRGMLIGLAIGSILMAVLLILFDENVHKPAVQTKPNQAPLATQN
ncbi:hypothetical protein [Sphingomonas faeni]|uniref:hypothetical protein n=1 Tax=Sphingomonas faeni TaxID=185950 RepID=UPI002785853B|nr:hypothetical protein [Sphingomonas faeni]MDQ0839420.1 hypothetical protein [Sphingomonas faeni]